MGEPVHRVRGLWSQKHGSAWRRPDNWIDVYLLPARPRKYLNSNLHHHAPHEQNDLKSADVSYDQSHGSCVCDHASYEQFQTEVLLLILPWTHGT